MLGRDGRLEARQNKLLTPSGSIHSWAENANSKLCPKCFLFANLSPALKCWSKLYHNADFINISQKPEPQIYRYPKLLKDFIHRTNKLFSSHILLACLTASSLLFSPSSGYARLLIIINIQYESSSLLKHSRHLFNHNIININLRRPYRRRSCTLSLTSRIGHVYTKITHSHSYFSYRLPRRIM